MTNEIIDVCGIQFGTSDNVAWPEVVYDDYAAECSEGREIANALIDAMRENNDPTLLGYTLEAIISNRRYGGLEIGFATALAEKLI